MFIHSTEFAKIPRRSRIGSIAVLWFFTILALVAARFALKTPTDYAMEQFLPKNHESLRWDRESKKVFQISESTPHILMLSFGPKGQKAWYTPTNLRKLEKLSAGIQRLKSVQSVTSLATAKAAYEYKDQLSVGTVRELVKSGLSPKSLLNDPVFTPNLISKDGRATAIFVSPHAVSQHKHRTLLREIRRLAQKEFPEARVQIGGPSAIRTQIIDLLSSEIVYFIALSALAAILVIKALFHGWSILPQIAFILTITNLLAGGLMGLFGIPFNVLTSTVPILVTICTLGNACHTLARMSPKAHLRGLDKWNELKSLMRELTGPHLMAAATTAIGFATLIPSNVPIISSYGLIVALCVMMASVTTLLLVPSMYLWLRWPAQREWMNEQRQFAFFLYKFRAPITYGTAALVVVMTLVGSRLSWTARLFDDLPASQSAKISTDAISRRLGGIAPLDLIIGHESLPDLWKTPANLQKLNMLSEKWRRENPRGSLVSLVDLMSVGSQKKTLPRSQAAAAEIQFLYAMGEDNPVRYFLSSDEKWTRIALRLPDLPADQMQTKISAMVADLQRTFPNLRVKTAGYAAVVPPMNMDLSRELMWGFFSALFWIVLMLAVSFRSLRWALVSVIPNLAPPAILLGVLALSEIPIRPGIAIIFSISIGIAFDNTIYVLQRLREFMKESRVKRRASLPMFAVMKAETTPCLISSVALVAGFSIFLFSYFPINKLFGAFMLISILAGLLGDLVWLPALLQKYPWLLLGRLKDENVEDTNQFQEWAMRASTFILFLALGFLAFRPVYAATSVQDLLRQVEQKQSPPDERVVLKLIIQEPDGTKKEREISILRKNEKDARALVKLLKPADLKGLSVLTVQNKGQEDQWLYMPSAKKSRRIVGSGKKGKFLDSEIAYEDLRISTYKQFNNKVTQENGSMIEVESVAKPGNESSYGRIHTWISKPDLHIKKVDYYDKDGKLLKQASFSNYQKIGDKFWRARKVSVNNVQEKRKTELILVKVSLKKISKEEVSLSSLEE